jgi:predicted transposase YbfD/YdcC
VTGAEVVQVQLDAEVAEPVKGNQKALLAKTTSLMADLALDHAQGTPVDYFEQSDDGHGRLETRRVWVTTDVQRLGAGLLAKWPGLPSVALVERTRQDLGDLTRKTTVERQLYIPSLKSPDARAIAGHVRGHRPFDSAQGRGGHLHWQLDVSFGEDDRRVRVGHGAENFSRLCRVALNLLKRDKTVKVGITTKRLNPGWDHDYLPHLINQCRCDRPGEPSAGANGDLLARCPPANFRPRGAVERSAVPRHWGAWARRAVWRSRSPNTVRSAWVGHRHC